MPVTGESIVVFGQDQDEYKGGFDTHQMFSGEIAGFEITERILDDKEISDLAACNSSLISGEVVFTTEDIENSDWELGRVRIYHKENTTEFCDYHDLRNVAVVGGNREFGEVNETCTVMGGRIPSVKDFLSGDMDMHVVNDRLVKIFQVNNKAEKTL